MLSTYRYPVFAIFGDLPRTGSGFSWNRRRGVRDEARRVGKPMSVRQIEG